MFLQFIDCVYQVLTQFPCSFEFNEKLLIDILDELFNCKYGTFLFDCEKEREQNQLRQKTTSFWTYVNLNKQTYQNPFYLPEPSVLQLSANPQDITFWKNYFLRWHQPSPVSLTKEMRCEMYKQMLESTKQRIKQLEEELQLLKNQQKNSNKE